MEYFSHVIGLAEHKTLKEFFKRHGTGYIRAKYLEYVEEYPSTERNVLSLLHEAIEACRAEVALVAHDPKALVYNRFRCTYMGRTVQFNPLDPDVIQFLVQKFDDIRDHNVLSKESEAQYRELLEEIRTLKIPITVSLELRLKRNPHLWARKSMRDSLFSELRQQAQASLAGRQLQAVWFKVAHPDAA